MRIDQRSRRKTARLAVKEDREAALRGSVMSVERLAKVESKLPGELQYRANQGSVLAQQVEVEAMM